MGCKKAEREEEGVRLKGTKYGPQCVSFLFRWEDRVAAVVHCALGNSWSDFFGLRDRSCVAAVERRDLGSIAIEMCSRQGENTCIKGEKSVMGSWVENKIHRSCRSVVAETS